MFLAERYGNVGIEFGRSTYTQDYTTTQSPIFDVGVADFGDMTEVRLLDGTVLLAKDRVILPKNLFLGKATGPRGSAHVAKGRAYEQAVHNEANLKILKDSTFTT